MIPEDHVRLRLNAQTALLCNVSAAMRLLAVEVRDERIRLLGYLDQSATENEWELLCDIASEIGSHFPDMDIVEVIQSVDTRVMSQLFQSTRSDAEAIRHVIYARFEQQHAEWPGFDQ
jgi:hypothetical protein